VTAAPPSHRLAVEPPWRPLVAAAALTVGLHLGVLGAWPGGERLRGAPASASSGSPSAATWQVRTVTAPADPPSATHAHAAAREMASEGPSPAVAPSEVAGTAPPPRPAPATMAAASTASAHLAAPLPADATQPQGTPAAGPPGEAGDEEYLPRRRLTRPPRTAEVLIPYPEQAPIGNWALRLTVFIDERGQVRRVRPAVLAPADDPSLEPPPELLDAAVQAFLATRYSPGELKGRAVKSRIDVAVEFRADAPSRAADGH
jgi:hypothetical protein